MHSLLVASPLHIYFLFRQDVQIKINKVISITQTEYNYKRHEGFVLGTFRTNSLEHNFLRTKFFETYFLELAGRLLIYCWCLEFCLINKHQLNNMNKIENKVILRIK